MGKASKYRPAKRDLRNATTLEKIFMWYQFPDEVQLTAVEERQRLRYKTAFTLMLTHHSTTLVVPILSNTFDISESQAYKDIRECKKLYGDVNKSDKEAERALLLEQINMAILKGQSEDNFNADVHYKLLKLKSEVMGFNRDEADIPNFDDLKPHTIMLGNFPETLGIKPIPNLEQEVKKLLSKGNSSIQDAEILE